MDIKFWNLEKQFTKLSCTGGWVEDRDNKFWNLEKQFTGWLSCKGWRQQILKLGKTIYKNFCGQKQTNFETWKNNL